MRDEVLIERKGDGSGILEGGVLRAGKDVTWLTVSEWVWLVDDVASSLGNTNLGTILEEATRDLGWFPERRKG